MNGLWYVFGICLAVSIPLYETPAKTKKTTYLWQTVAVSIGGIVPPQLLHQTTKQ